MMGSKLAFCINSITSVSDQISRRDVIRSMVGSINISSQFCTIFPYTSAS